MCFHQPRIPKHRILEDRSRSSMFRRSSTRLHLARWVAFMAFVFILLIVAAEVTRADPAPSEGRNNDEPQSGQLLIRSDTEATNKKRQHAIHLSSDVVFNVNGMVITTRLSQTFKNPSDQWVEGIYLFPLPDTAAISRLEMKIGERIIVGEIKEKQQAKRQYQQAKAAGKKAALVEQERPNLFTQHVANIGPNQQVTITLEYQDTVQYSGGRFSFQFPMTLTSRYIPGQALAPNTEMNSEADNESVEQTTQLILDNTRPWGWSAPTDSVADAQRISPPQISSSTVGKSHRITLRVQLNAGLPLQTISSPYHDLVIEKHNQLHAITTSDASVAMDRDFVLQWRPVAEQAPSAAAFIETLTSTEQTPHDYALLMLLPPTQPSTSKLPRDVIYIIDTSGSMGGESIVQAKQSLQLALQRLSESDHFNVIEFNSNHRLLFSQSQIANAHNRRQAQAFVGQLKANGGTNMAPALQAALQSPASPSHLRQVVFITDGSVGNEAQLFSIIHRQLDNARLFTVGIGSAPNSFFMRRAAQFGRGTFTHIGSQAVVAEKMSELFNKLESPVLRNLTLDWPGALKADVWPKQLPDLYQGEPLLIKVRFDSPLSPTPQTLRVSGDTGAAPWQRELSISSAGQTLDNSPTGIAKLWAREKIRSLLDDKIRGRDEATVRTDVLAVALEHQLMSPYTSFVAIDNTPSRPVDQAVSAQLVPNLTPQGHKTVAYPKTATHAPLNLALGLLALILAALLHVTQRAQRRSGLHA